MSKTSTSAHEAVSRFLRGLRETPWLWNPFLWAIVIRTVMALAVPRQIQGDAVDYEQIAVNLSAGRGFTRCFFEPFHPTAQRPPLYPMVLALLYIVGIGSTYGPILLNTVCDLISMRLLRAWTGELRLSWAKHTPWVIALCPLLVTYGMYPTTENLSITLFLLSALLLHRKQPVAAGLSWGLLSLCRSYYLLFPVALFLAHSKVRVVRQLGWRGYAIILAMSFAAPTVWMLRNYTVIGKVTFTQTSMVGWQSYQGLCVANFDWWRPEHLAHVHATPELQRMVASHCAKEEDTAAMDRDVLALVSKCVLDNPAAAARNVLAKGLMLFVNWGLFMPYNRVPFVVQHIVNAFMYLLWLSIFLVLWRARARVLGAGPLGELTRFGLLNLVYIVAVTIPFAVDARYMLGPFLVLLIAAFEVARTPGRLLGSFAEGSAAER